MDPDSISIDLFDMFEELVAKPENQACFDCNSSTNKPTWALISHGVFICPNCTCDHDSLPDDISFARPVCKGSWTAEELKMMSLGGNNRARVFFEQHGWTTGGRNIEEKYTSAAAKLYGQLLLQELASSIAEYKKLVGAKTTRNTTGIGVPNLTPEAIRLPNSSELQIQETYEARRKFPNAKSISSAQFFWDQEKMNDTEPKLCLQKFASSNAISSADLFGGGMNNPPIVSTSTAISSADLVEREVHNPPPITPTSTAISHADLAGRGVNYRPLITRLKFFLGQLENQADEDFEKLIETIGKFENKITSYASSFTGSLPFLSTQ